MIEDSQLVGELHHLLTNLPSPRISVRRCPTVFIIFFLFLTLLTNLIFSVTRTQLGKDVPSSLWSYFDFCFVLLRFRQREVFAAQNFHLTFIRYLFVFLSLEKLYFNLYQKKKILLFSCQLNHGMHFLGLEKLCSQSKLCGFIGKPEHVYLDKQKDKCPHFLYVSYT